MDNSKLRTLYKKTKTGAIQKWTVCTDGEKIISSTGQMGGKVRVSVKTAVAKNVGRSNATTAEEQAMLEALAMWNKRKDAGYFEIIEEAKNTLVFLPMLASDFEERKGRVNYPVSVQPKLDGVRCMAYWKGDDVVLMSRGGKPYDIEHIREDVKQILPKGQVFDGEIYKHGATFQSVVKLVKKYRFGETEELEFWVYDTFKLPYSGTSWAFRLTELDKLKDRPVSSIRICPTYTAADEKTVYKLREKYVERGFEGAIVREASAPYEIGRRSNHLLKVKTFMDGEYKIIGHTDGVGLFEKCVIWICETKDKQEFRVVPKGTIEEKKAWYAEGDKHHGSWLKVKYFELTDDGIPRFPVGLGIRLPEDM